MLLSLLATAGVIYGGFALLVACLLLYEKIGGFWKFVGWLGVLAVFLVGLMLATARANAADIIDRRVAAEGYEHSIHIDGKIWPGDEVVFRTIALEIPLAHSVEVVLSSPGGSIAAFAIGRIIRQRGWTTIAIDQCNSACAYIWLAGYKREISLGTVLGFHQVGEDCANGCQRISGAGNALLGAYLNELGFDEKAIRLFTKAPPAEFTWVSPAALAQYGISFEMYGPKAKPEPPTQPSYIEALRKALISKSMRLRTNYASGPL
jgi:hypothetical protein